MLSLKCRVFVALWACFSATTAFASDSPPEFRGLWADAWHEGLQNQVQVSNLVWTARALNANALFVQVRRRGDVLYLGSPFEPVAKSVTLGFDPLGEVLRLAHNTNLGPRLEVHAWMVVYPVATVFTLTNKQTLITANQYEKHPFKAHPDWLDETDSGTQLDTDQYALDPGHPGVQKYLVDVAMDIVSRYDVDGFHLDHVRYPGSRWGYNKVSVSRYNALHHRFGKPNPFDPSFAKFRREQITALVRKLYLTTIALKPALKFSASTITWTPAVRTDQEWPRSLALRAAFQDWRAWMEEGILDINVPMVFFAPSSPISKQMYTDWANFAKDHRYKRHVVIGQASFKNSLSDSLNQVQAARGPSLFGAQADGVALYSYALPVEGGTNRAAFVEAFAGTKRLQSRPHPAPFAKPASIPEMPWKTKPKTGHFSGYVLDEQNSIALDGATVTLHGASQKTLTSDGTGFVGAIDLPPGQYEVVANFAGYSAQTNSCSIEPGKVCSRNFVLTK